jgi:hypothetical protein
MPGSTHAVVDTGGVSASQRSGGIQLPDSLLAVTQEHGEVTPTC